MTALVLRHEDPPDDAVVLLRGGVMAHDSIVRTATTSFERHGFYGVSDAAPPWDLWIDYMAREPSGLTPTLLRYASPGADIRVGSYVLVGSEDAELAVAEVVEIDDRGVAMVRVLPGPADDHRHLLSGR